MQDSDDEIPVPTQDERYRDVLVNHIRNCAKYRPKFGTKQRAGLTREEFTSIYAADPFYHWVGLDSPLMYAAHRAAGGMTSVYKHLGHAGERIFQLLLQDQLGIGAAEASWSYRVPLKGQKARILKLDGRIDLAHVRGAEIQARVRNWLELAFDRIAIPRRTRGSIRGAVFEVRQGYKSEDAKRAKGDVDNAVNAYVNQYMPVIFLLSTQMASSLKNRYAASRWLILTGTSAGSATESSYAFCKDVLGYDLAGMLGRNSTIIRREVETVLQALLRANP